MKDKNATDIHTKSLKTAKTSISNKDEGNNDYLDIAELVRSIQRAENNFDCFRKGHNDCNQFKCAWREYCLNEVS
ncbi:MAG: hypothetical protein KKA75_07020 [Proteobacteria bacterium]|nr:hypothetical protein [Pseudomonadota bacterium]